MACARGFAQLAPRATDSWIAINPPRLVVLVGTSHDFQLAKSSRDPGGVRFEHYLSKLCKAVGVAAVAGEMSLEAMEQSHLSSSVPMQIATMGGLPHRHCDPDSSERRRLNITDDENSMRARGWIASVPPAEIDALVEAEYRT